MRIGHIVACDRNHGIGLNNKIPWNNKEDLKRFKETTVSSGVVIMGHNTYKSLPFDDGLPERKNIVITTKQISNTKNTCFVNTIEEALSYAEFFFKEKGNFDSALLYIIGGAQIYELSKPYIDFIDLTYIEEYTGICDTHYKIPDGFSIVNSFRSVTTDIIHRLYFKDK